VPAETRSVETSSAYARAYAALRDGQTAAARDLTDQILGEAVEARDLFPPFITRARDFLLDRGLTAGQLRAEEARLGALLDPAGEGVDPEAAWHALRAAADEAVRCCAAGRGDEAAALLDAARRAWCAAHDRACDWIYGLLDAAARHLGEELIGAMWDALMSDFYATRDDYDPAARPWDDSVRALLADAVASLRGHLSGLRTDACEPHKHRGQHNLRHLAFSAALGLPAVFESAGAGAGAASAAGASALDLVKFART